MVVRDTKIVSSSSQAVSVPAKHMRGSRSSTFEKIKHGGLIAKPVLFVFLNGCVQPTVSDTLFYWMTDDLCNSTSAQTPCTDHGPMFSQVFMSTVDCAAYAGFIAGIVIYNKYVWLYDKWFDAALFKLSKVQFVLVACQLSSPRLSHLSSFWLCLYIVTDM